MLTLSLTTGVFALIFGCENCTEQLKDYWNITGIHAVEVLDQNGAVPVVDTFYGTELILKIDCSTEFVADHDISCELPFSFLGANTCRAMGRIECTRGHLGMRDPIATINVYSNKDFGIYPRETSLNPIITIAGCSVRDWVEDKKFNFYATPYESAKGIPIVLLLTEKPASGLTHSLVVEITTREGEKYRHYVSPITWA